MAYTNWDGPSTQPGRTASKQSRQHDMAPDNTCGSTEYMNRTPRIHAPAVTNSGVRTRHQPPTRRYFMVSKATAWSSTPLCAVPTQQA